MTSPNSQFYLRVLTISCLALTSCVIGKEDKSNPEKTPNQAGYAWAYQDKEGVIPVPHIQESLQIDDESTVDRLANAYQARDPWGKPESLLNPVSVPKAPKKLTPKQAPTAIGGKSKTGTDTGAGNTINLNITSQPSPTETVEDKEAVLATPAPSRSRLEDLYSGQFKRQANRQLKQFGYEAFRHGAGLSISSGPPPQSYICLLYTSPSPRDS